MSNMEAAATTAGSVMRPLAEINVPGGRRATTTRTLTAWAAAGVRVGPRTIYLRAERRGGRWWTCEDWLNAFFAELTAAARDKRKGTA